MVLALATTAASAETIRLDCTGTARVQTSRFISGQAYGSNGTSANGWATTVDHEQQAARVTVELSDGSGRVLLPSAMVPPIHASSNDGWWPLDDVRTTDAEVTAHFRLNPINKPSLRIDRSSGALEIDGRFGGFAGVCRRITAADHLF